MADETQFQRDFYTGLLAKKLDAAGYYDGQQMFYGFLAWQDGAQQFVCAEEEQLCCEAYLDWQRKGAVLTDMLGWKAPISGKATAQEHQLAMQELEEELLRREGTAFAEQIAQREAQADNGQFLKEMNTLRQQFPQQNHPLRVTVYGFAVRQKTGIWNYESSTFLPTVLKQWQQERQQGLLVTPILDGSYYKKDYPIFALQEQFEADLRRICDTTYLKRYEHCRGIQEPAQNKQ